ncbi:MAG: YwiC-like family protein [Actinomycetota bacterium]
MSLLPFSGKVDVKAWYQPLFSPEHGVYIMLLISFLTGAAAAKSWTLATTLALICAFFGYEARSSSGQHLRDLASYNRGEVKKWVIPNR